MASINMYKQLDEQPLAKKPRIDNPEDQGKIAKCNEASLPKSVEMMEHKESGISTAIMDLPIRHPLPLELNCEIFKCLKLPNQRKFIWGLGQDIYEMFGQKLLKKTKRVCNPHGNRWNGTNTTAIIAADGLNVSSQIGSPIVFAEQSFPISGPLCRMDGFPGTILYYYEVKGFPWAIGVCDGTDDDDDDDGGDDNGIWIGHYSDAYVSPCGFNGCWLAGEFHYLVLPEGAIKPEKKEYGMDVFGCGLVLDPEDKLAIFFTRNGNLRGRKIPISPTVDLDRLFPSFQMFSNTAIAANFGDDPAKPFEYDIKNCPDLALACI